MFGIIASWISGLLRKLGLAEKNAKILFLGLDHAGKTTLLRVLKDDRLAVHVPTLYPNSEELLIGKIRFRTFDLGGHETARRIWRDYFAEVDGIIFIVDGADRTRFPEASEELSQLLQEPGLAGVPVVVLGNKIDVPTAVSEDELRRQLNLPPPLYHPPASTKGSASRPVELFMCSVVKRMGYAEAFRWLADFLS